MAKSVQVRINKDAKSILDQLASRSRRSVTNYLSWLIHKMAEENKDQAWLDSLKADAPEDPHA